MVANPYRLQFWIQGKPEQSRKEWHYTACLLCACYRARQLANAMCSIAKVDRSLGMFTVSKGNGVTGQMVVIATSEGPYRDIKVIHACK